MMSSSEPAITLSVGVGGESGGAPADSPPTPTERVMAGSEDDIMLELGYYLKKDTDLLIGWNSEDFDDKYLDTRIRKYPVPYDKHSFQTFDLYKIVGFKSEKKRESDRLEDVVDDILVQSKKLGWTKTVERHNGKYHILFQKDVPKLKQVNLSHSRAVRDI